MPLSESTDYHGEGSPSRKPGFRPTYSMTRLRHVVPGVRCREEGAVKNCPFILPQHAIQWNHRMRPLLPLCSSLHDHL
jgi:hypothetical protein